MDPMGFVRRAAVPAGCAALAAAASLACSRSESPAMDALDARTTRAEISTFAGGEAERCVFSAPDLELCSWRLGPEDPAWASQASAVGTDGDVNLVCELPIDGSPRVAGSCRPHASALQAAATAEELPAVSAPGSLEARREAEQRLAEALSVSALSHALGDAPDRCRTGAGVQTCEWDLADGATGHALVAALVDDARSGAAVRLSCVVPLDGSSREADSCKALWVE
jgi:hypothetical protein